MFTDEIRRRFLKRYGISLRDLSRRPQLSNESTAKYSAKTGVLLGRGYPFFGETINVEKEESVCAQILKKW